MPTDPASADGRISFAGYMACDDADEVAGILRAWLPGGALDLKVRVMGWEIVLEAPGTYVYCYDALEAQRKEALLQGHVDGEAALSGLAACLRERGIAFALEEG